MWLFVHHPRLFTEDTKAAHELKEQVFTTSVEVIEFGSLLDRGKHTSKYAWLFYTYNQWHAVTYVLSELCHRSPSPAYERAWQAVNDVYDKRMLEFPKRQRGVLWKPIRQLYHRARARREAFGYPGSPKSNSESTRSMSVDSPSNTTPKTTAENWLGANPYINAVSTAGDALGLDFNDPSFNRMNLATNGESFDFAEVPADMSQFQQFSKTPLQTLPFGWNTGVTDYFDQQTAQPSWIVPQAMDEWQ